jgi:hypothetical protein
MNDPTPTERPRIALGTLPDFEPPADGWQGIEARLDTAPRAARARLAVALAALVVVAIGARIALTPGAPPAPASDAASAAAAGPSADQLLDRRAADLERLLAALPAPRVARASTGYATTLLEDRIALLDERLGLPDAATLSPATTAELKKQRVVLLDSLVRVKYASAVTASL